MSVLADTSIWVDYLRGREPAASELERLIRRGEATICGPVLAELLAGARDRAQADRLLELGALPTLDVTRQTWRRAGELARELRAAGRTVPLIDSVIAVLCAQAGVALWTRDRDFRRIRRSLPELEVYRPT